MMASLARNRHVHARRHGGLATPPLYLQLYRPLLEQLQLTHGVRGPASQQRAPTEKEDVVTKQALISFKTLSQILPKISEMRLPLLPSTAAPVLLLATAAQPWGRTAAPPSMCAAPKRILVCSGHMCDCVQNDGSPGAAHVLAELQKCELPDGTRLEESPCLGQCATTPAVCLEYPDGTDKLVAGLDNTLRALGVERGVVVQSTAVAGGDSTGGDGAGGAARASSAARAAATSGEGRRERRRRPLRGGRGASPG